MPDSTLQTSLYALLEHIVEIRSQGDYIIYDAPRSKTRRSAQPDESDPEYKNGPNGFELDAALFWASGTQ